MNFHSLTRTAAMVITCLINKQENMSQIEQQAIQIRHDRGYEITHMIGVGLSG